MQIDRARARDRGEQRDLGEREGLTAGGRPVAIGEPVEHGAGLERDDPVAADFAGAGFPASGWDERCEPHLDE
jgi:hypothetical protein